MDFNSILESLLGGANTTTDSQDTFAAMPGADSLGAPSKHGTGTGRSGRMPQNPLLDTLAPFLGGQFSPVLRIMTLLHQLFGERLGIDPTFLLTFVAVAWAANHMWRQLYRSLEGFVLKHFMASIHVSSTDEIYSHMMKWLAEQPIAASSRSLTAETVSPQTWDRYEQEGGENKSLEILQLRKIAGGGDAKYLNFSNQKAKTPPRFIPAVGIHGFWHDGWYFRLSRSQQSVIDMPSDGGGRRSGSARAQPVGGAGSRVDKEETLVVSCFGRSTEPIKRLLGTVKAHYYSGRVARTTIQRASGFGRYSRSWAAVSVRPVRPLDTVVLDDQQKGAVLADMNEYLHPATPRWYANRGIPLRRGYLFHGPPGTGKTSLSFALAGVFGLDIFVISLLEPSLTEEELNNLFSNLPRRCVVLLEDIDAAGLRRPEEAEEEHEEGEKESEKQDDKGDGQDKGEDHGEDRKPEDKKQDGNDTAKNKPAPPLRTTNGDTAARNARIASFPPPPKRLQEIRSARIKRHGGGERLRGASAGDADDKNGGVSLSGLLNAIDGVASQEGRVLVMTTNRPESLDEALVRPGRIDLQVGFSNATSDQAGDLFKRMYGSDLPPGSEEESKAKDKFLHEKQKQQQEQEQQQQQPSMNGSQDNNAVLVNGVDDTDDRLDLVPDELDGVAAEFGAKIPDGLLSPAEIQGFLLKRKKEPRRALSETDRWVTAMKEQKQSKSRVLIVQ